MAVFDHLFLTIGNGFEWSGGELVDIFENPKRLDNVSVQEIQEEGLEKLAELTPGEPYSDYTIGQWEYQIQNVEKLVATLVYPFEYDHFYGIHEEYSRITKLPDNITPDWFQAVKDFVCAYEVILNSKHQHAPYQLISKTEAQKELDKLLPIKKRIDEIEAKFLKMSNEEYAAHKQRQVEFSKKIIQEILDEERTRKNSS